ncbi:MAG: hypothetical protein JOY68_03505 [Candidatus Dormibacteraeota bacterium]|nr:hypothetical protein [Candidatus Dormibacteraeota bacterium]
MSYDKRSTAAVSPLRRTYPARLEVDTEPGAPAPQRYARLRQTLRDPVSVLFLLGACLAQAADTITTAVALSGRSFFEANGLMRAAVTQPLEIGGLKLLLVLLVCLLAMLRLPTRQARLALLFAFGLSAFAPIQNLLQVLLH